jgi:proline iminopeptidase
LWSIYLARQFETDWVNAGRPRYQLPAEWNRFIALVPDEFRENGTDIMRYYADKIRSSNKAEAKRYAMEWYLWEGCLVSLNYDPQLSEADAISSPNALATAMLETHYYLNGCFVPDGYILDNISKLRNIPSDVVHGRFDLCTPAIGAFDLDHAYGSEMQLWWVNSGHLRSEPLMLRQLQTLAAEHLT